MKALYAWAKSKGMMFIMDETQAGMGRSGNMYCYTELGIEPDMLILGKALGNGMHISALLAKQEPEKEMMPALLGGVGGDTLASAAACEVFRQLEGGLLSHVNDTGNILKQRLKQLEEYSCVLETRCVGLAAGIEFRDADVCRQVYDGLTDMGYLIGHSTNPANIVIKPPYVITETQINKFVGEAEALIKECT